MYMYIYMYTSHVHTCMHVHVHVCLNMYMYMHVHVWCNVKSQLRSSRKVMPCTISICKEKKFSWMRLKLCMGSCFKILYYFVLYEYINFTSPQPSSQTYGITVQHATKSEIGVLKSKGVVGGKAGRCALFSARDVCRMFLHWKSVPPQPLRELAEGKVRPHCTWYICKYSDTCERLDKDISQGSNLSNCSNWVVVEPTPLAF